MVSHALYISAIVLLLIVVVFLLARLSRASEAVAECGLGPKAFPRAGALRAYSPQDILRPKTFEQYRAEIDDIIARAHRLNEFGGDTVLARACGVALEGGKRIRSVIMMEVARASALAQRARCAELGKDEPDPVDVGDAALFIEYLHSASLVVDDLPEFDNDAVRRGKKSLHAEVGPAVAQMAALSLVAAAFQNVCRQLDWIRENCPGVKNVDRIGTILCHCISRALGAHGAAGGQYMDVSSPDDFYREHGQGAMMELMYRKTATFFEVAVLIGWVMSGGDLNAVEVMRKIGREVGIAFQIADDVGDMKKDAARAARGFSGWNYANCFGREGAIAELRRRLAGARALMSKQGLWTDLWELEIFPAVWSMTAAPADAAAAPAGAAAAPGEAPDGGAPDKSLTNPGLETTAATA
jgi:geranylgeranyl diphosphate synthase type II